MIKNPEITILTHDARWKGLAPTVRRAVEAALTKQKQKKVALAIVLSHDVEVQTLNRDYRKKDKPTNVLSFPDGSVEEGVRQLGDIILAYDIIAREAAEQQKPIKAHITHLTIHGVLHLLGFDHETEKEAAVMESIEISVLKRMGIANPYESS
jgi:probable rRNA maturation factor